MVQLLELYSPDESGWIHLSGRARGERQEGKEEKGKGVEQIWEPGRSLEGPGHASSALPGRGVVGVPLRWHVVRIFISFEALRILNSKYVVCVCEHSN